MTISQQVHNPKKDSRVDALQLFIIRMDKFRVTQRFNHLTPVKNDNESLVLQVNKDVHGTCEQIRSFILQ
jgi:hypothetical protein